MYRIKIDMNEEAEKRERRTVLANSEIPVRSKLLILQLICGAVIIFVLFAVSKSGGATYNGIKGFYDEMQKIDMPVSEIIGAIKTTAKETFAPIADVPKTEESDSAGDSNELSPV